MDDRIWMKKGKGKSVSHRKERVFNFRGDKNTAL